MNAQLNRFVFLGISLGAFVVPALTSFAADPEPPKAAPAPAARRGLPTLDESLAQGDQDRDGRISEAEAAQRVRAAGARPAPYFVRFHDVDADGDGFATRAELHVFRVRLGVDDNGNPIVAGREMVKVGDRQLEILRHGKGSPTVVFESGASDGDAIRRWTEILALLGENTPALCYARAGRGGSSPATGPRTPEAVTDELHALLANAGNAPPYILVGASWGALYTRIFALRYPQEVAGLVLIEGVHERELLEQYRAEGLTGQEIERKLAANREKQAATPGIQNAEWLGMAEVTAKGTLEGFGRMPDIPVAVLTSLKGYRDAAGKIVDASRGRARDLQAEILRTSSQSMQVVTSHAGHMIDADDPKLVADAIRWVLNEARKEQRRRAAPAVR